MRFEDVVVVVVVVVAKKMHLPVSTRGITLLVVSGGSMIPGRYKYYYQASSNKASIKNHLQ